MKRKVNVFIFLIFISSFVNAFEIYGFIPWRLEHNNQLISDRQIINQILEKKGIKKIDVVYHNRMLTNGEVDSKKIEKIALNSNKSIPISFDYELGNRFKPETVLPNISKIIDIYYQSEGVAPIGIYAMLPQNTYGGLKLNEETKERYTKLNKQYEVLAPKINFLSPSFYFYNGEDLDAWKKSVDFNMEQSLQIAKKYNLKIYPYVTNTFRFNGRDKDKAVIKPLTQEQMFMVLSYLKEKGADGAIIWAGSGTREANGKLPVINFEDPWFQGIQQFINQK